MKNKLLVTAVLAIAVNTLAMAAPSPEPGKEGKPAREEKAGKVKPYPLKTCIVSGDALEAMDDTVAFTHKGQEIKLCCKPCKKDFDKDPVKYLRKLKAR
ncbi:MAG: hypothetical protein EOP86_12465 [Verrucomicrobiaceae bacterium]|nr:MAG: hypothetical protein EOP86_12465 [Verrucomicrobiaceae bacterium]